MPIEERVLDADGNEIETRTKRTCKEWVALLILLPLKIITCLMLLCVVAAFAIIIKFIVLASSKTAVDATEKAFVCIASICYGVLGIMLILAETESLKVMFLYKKVAMLYWWGARGACCSFLGVVAISSTKQLGSALHVEFTDGKADSDPLIMFALISGWMILSAGLLRILLSIFCVRDWAATEANRELAAHFDAFVGSGGTVNYQRAESVVEVKTVVQKPKPVPKPAAVPPKAGEAKGGAVNAVDL